MEIFVRTDQGFVRKIVRESQIVLDFYGDGLHEILEIAQELGLDRQYSIITTKIADDDPELLS